MIVRKAMARLFVATFFAVAFFLGSTGVAAASGWWTFWDANAAEDELHYTGFESTTNGGTTSTPGWGWPTVYAVTWGANSGCYNAASARGYVTHTHSTCQADSYCWWHWGAGGSWHMFCQQTW